MDEMCRHTHYSLYVENEMLSKLKVIQNMKYQTAR